MEVRVRIHINYRHLLLQDHSHFLNRDWALLKEQELGLQAFRTLLALWGCAPALPTSCFRDRRQLRDRNTEVSFAS